MDHCGEVKHMAKPGCLQLSPNGLKTHWSFSPISGQPNRDLTMTKDHGVRLSSS